MASEREKICKFFKFGFCKFKSSCKNKHVLELCNDKKCNINLCEKRHPRLCKYYERFGNCKLGSICAYAHKENESKIVEKLEQQVDELCQIVLKKEAIIDQLVNDVKELKNIVASQNQKQNVGSEMIDEKITLEENEDAIHDEITLEENENDNVITLEENENDDEMTLEENENNENNDLCVDIDKDELVDEDENNEDCVLEDDNESEHKKNMKKMKADLFKLKQRLKEKRLFLASL